MSSDQVKDQIRQAYRPHRLDSAKVSQRVEIIVRDKYGRVKYTSEG